jgi:hypothetical protein
MGGFWRAAFASRPPLWWSVLVAGSFRRRFRLGHPFCHLHFDCVEVELAPRCIGENSRKIWISLPITCWTNTTRQNWNLNESKYCADFRACLAYHGHTCTKWQFPSDEVRATCRATRLGVTVSEQHPFLGQIVEIRRTSALTIAGKTWVSSRAPWRQVFQRLGTLPPKLYLFFRSTS